MNQEWMKPPSRQEHLIQATTCSRMFMLLRRIYECSGVYGYISYRQQFQPIARSRCSTRISKPGQSQYEPARVPAVLEMPMTTPAWRGAMSMWLTEKPPRASPAIVNVHVVAAMPCAGPCAAGISISAAAAPTNPAESSRRSSCQDICDAQPQT